MNKKGTFTVDALNTSSIWIAYIGSTYLCKNLAAISLAQNFTKEYWKHLISLTL